MLAPLGGKSGIARYGFLCHAGHRCGIAGVKHQPVVCGGYHHCGVGIAGGGSAHHKRYGHALTLHHGCHAAHLLERRGYQAAQCHHIGIYLFGFGYNFFAGHHHAEVGHFIAVAAQHHGHYVFAYVVHVAFHGGYHHASGIAGFAATLFFDIRIEPTHGLLHGSGALNHLWQKEFSFAEKHTHAVDAAHKRTIYHGYGAAEALMHLRQQFFHAVAVAALHHAAQAVLGTESGVGEGGRCGFAHFLVA